MNNTKIFAFDMGANSIGWFVQNMNENDETVEIVAGGSRIFDNSRDPKTNVPLSVARREATSGQTRRDRQLMRTQYLCKLLKKYALLPQTKEKADVSSRNPYKLRANGVKKKIDLYGIGRAILHINKRRGFLSNKKVDKNNDELGGMKLGIEQLKNTLNGKTLGEFLYERQQKKLGTRMRAETIKNKNSYEFYADRAMYQDEFKKLWQTQMRFHRNLTSEIGDKIFNAVFYQRPLKIPERGFCQFEDGQRRAYKAYPISQKCRILQESNALELIDMTVTPRCLTTLDKKEIATALLTSNKKLVKDYKATFASIKRFLNKEYTRFKLNFETENRKFLLADKTSAIMSAPECFGEDWNNITDILREEIIDKLFQESEDDVKKYLLNQFNFNENKAIAIIDASLKLDEGTTSLSAKAMHKIVPHLQDGQLYYKACELAGYNFNTNYDGEKFDKLPYYGEILKKNALGGDTRIDGKLFPEKHYGKINNPTVHVALNQFRKLVNKLIDVYGKPDRIVIETARELPLGEKGLKDLTTIHKKNIEKNEEIAIELKNLGVKNNYENRMKYKLWEDLSIGRCPFCGKQICMSELFTSSFEIEHLLPLSQSFDDSRANKVISCRSCNREKGNRTPYEAFAFSNDTKYVWSEIMRRASFLNKSKSWRFNENAMDNFEEKHGDFIARMLNDTRYMSKIAREYCTAILESKNILTVTGMTTGKLRHQWGLDDILNKDIPDSEGDETENEDENDKEKSPTIKKNRKDHRHHAIDAFVISCLNRKSIKAISVFAKKTDSINSKIRLDDMLKLIPNPLINGKREIFENLIDNIVASHKLDRGDVKLARKTSTTTGQLHKETAFGKINTSDNDDKTITTVTRKKITSLDFAIKNIQEIADNKIRNDLIDIFAESENKNIWIQKINQYAQSNNIRRVRIHKKRTLSVLIPIKDKNGKVYKYMDNDSNYCMDIYKPSNSDIWDFEILTTYNAHRNPETKWHKIDPKAKLIMRLFKGDTIIYEKNGVSVMRIVKQIKANSQIGLAPLNTIGETKFISVKPLQKLNPRKIYIDEIGRIYDAKGNSQK